MFAAQEDETDLRTVAVGDDDAIAALQQVRDVPHRFDHGCILVRHALVPGILDERVAADGDDKGFHDGRPAEFRASNATPVLRQSSRYRTPKYAMHWAGRR